MIHVKLYALLILIFVSKKPQRIFATTQEFERMDILDELFLNTTSEIDNFFVRELIPPESLPSNTSHNFSKHEESHDQLCYVAMNKTLEYCLRASNIMECEPFSTVIDKNYLMVHEDNGHTFKEFFLPSIQLPLETIPESRFKFFYKSAPFSFCANSTVERDTWMNSITEAIFCIHSKREVSPLQLDVGEKVKLSPFSTKDKRWKELLVSLKGKRKQVEKESMNTSQTNEVEIVNLLEGKPKVFVNGEKLPLFLYEKMNETAALEENEETPSS